MRIIVTENTFTEAGMSNGSFGFVKQICADTKSNFTIQSINGVTCYFYDRPPTYIIAEMENHNIHITLQNLPPNHVPFKPIERKFTLSFKLKNNSDQRLQISRSQVNIVPAYAITDYKSQSKTFKYIFIDLRKSIKGITTWMSNYVALSRARLFSNICIMSEWSVSDLMFEIPDDLNIELNRLRTLHTRTIAQFQR